LSSPVAGPLPATEQWLAERIADGALFSGAQVSVVHAGRVVVDLAVGRDGAGSAVRPSTQFRVYCAAKPLLAAVVCRAAERGVIDRNRSLATFHPGIAGPVGNVLIDDVLHHQTPFTQPTGFGSVFIPNGTRTAAIVSMCESALRQARPNGYGEVAGWLLLSQAVAWAAGERWTTLVTDLCDDGRIDTSEVSLDAETLRFKQRRGQVGLNVSQREGRVLPLLGERDPSLSERLDGPGFGPACSMRFLAAFLHDAVVRRGYGDPDRGRVVRADPTYRRDLTFSDGLMVGPDTLGISDLWPADVVGQNGIGGMTIGFASRSLDLAVGIHLNGLMGPTDGGDHVRPFLTSLLHSELREVLSVT
jgi:hypothetical protein